MSICVCVSSLAGDGSDGDARALGSLLLWRGRCLTLLAFGRPRGPSVNPLECSCTDTASRCLKEIERENVREGSQTWISEDVKAFFHIYICGVLLRSVICLY